MAPLYKRYIPPKTTTSQSAQNVATPARSLERTRNATPTEQPKKKRKRERSEEEIAERKAKKWRKMGIETHPTPVIAPQTSETVTLSEQGKATPPQALEKDEPVRRELKGEFAHVRSIKKRHKLEKEARKTRGVADQAARLNGRQRSEKAPVGGNVQASHEATKAEDARELPQPPPETVDGQLVHGQDDRELGGEVRRPKKVQKRDQSFEAEESNVSQIVQTPEQANDPRNSVPKKRRHKLESVLQRNDSAQQPPDDDREHLRKHSSVLAKFQNSAGRQADVLAPDFNPHLPPKEPTVLHDLTAIPQPERLATPEFKPDYSTLPSWLANPTVVPSDKKASFVDLNLDSKTVEHLTSLGLSDALSVQQVLIPLLLPPGTPGASFRSGTESLLPDLAVSAPTGSGKTLAYLLPIIESLRQAHGLGRLKALIVVPTRELVAQVASVAEDLAVESGVQIGTATGNDKIKDGNGRLIQRSHRYDPEGHRRLIEKANKRNYPPNEDSEDFEEYVEQLEDEDAREEQRISDAVTGLVNHVPVYQSACDVLICTPGRLLEHVDSTLGFSLTHLEWVVLDEVDKLLDQQYDGFLETLHVTLTKERTVDEQDARELYLRSKSLWDEQRERRLRKIVLSATMTRDISKLSALKLKRPRMIVVRGSEHDIEQDPDEGADGAEAREIGDGFELPRTLTEHCVPVGDGTEKSLHLVELLESTILPSDVRVSAKIVESIPKSSDSEGSEDEDENLDSASELNSESSSEVSTDDSDDIKHGDAATVPVEEDIEPVAPMPMDPSRAAMLSNRRSSAPRATDSSPTILIFTSSTESANRLSHLLRTLKPIWSPWINTLTKTKARRGSGARLLTSRPSITISTDRSARGLDHLANRAVTHVIQYDVPRSLTSYVHRVGRTARAGRSGEAWTLYTFSEARWFLKEVAQARNVKRAGAVEKVKLSISDQILRAKYHAVLANMREEVFGSSKM